MLQLHHPEVVQFQDTPYYSCWAALRQLLDLGVVAARVPQHMPRLQRTCHCDAWCFTAASAVPAPRGQRVKCRGNYL